MNNKLALDVLIDWLNDMSCNGRILATDNAIIDKVKELQQIEKQIIISAKIEVLEEVYKDRKIKDKIESLKKQLENIQ